MGLRNSLDGYGIPGRERWGFVNVRFKFFVAFAPGRMVPVLGEGTIFSLCLCTLFHLGVAGTCWLFRAQEIGKGIYACGVIPALVERYR